MCFNPYAVQMMMEERVMDALREAEQNRLGRVASSAKIGLLDRVLARIGVSLISAGKELQERHAPVKTGLMVSQSPRRPTTKL